MRAATIRGVGTILGGTVLLLAAVGNGSSGVAEARSHLSAEAPVTIRFWGDAQMGSLLARWEAGFRRLHPEVRFQNKLKGTDTAMAGLYHKVADMALMGREINHREVMAFQWIYRYKPDGIQVATGGASRPGQSAPLEIFVNSANPVRHFTLAQLDAIFGSEPHEGLADIRRWGQVGLRGPWAKKPIHVYSYDLGSERANYFRLKVLGGSYKWNCDIRTFPHTSELEKAQKDPGRQILEAVSKDRYAIGMSDWGYSVTGVRPLALGRQPAGDFYAPTKSKVEARKYPLFQAVYIYFNRAPRAAIAPQVKDFLLYVLSAQGQDDVRKSGDYLPLPTAVASVQRARLR